MPVTPTPDPPGKQAEQFGALHSHGFVRVAAAVPEVGLADPLLNGKRAVALAHSAAADGAALVVFPELGLSAYTADDLFHQQTLLGAVRTALADVCSATRDLPCLIAVGAPLVTEQGLFNTAVAIHRGSVLGVVPKSYLPNYREFYEKRQFRSARDAQGDSIELLGSTVPFGTDLIFTASDVPDLAVHLEICEDLWTAIPPSSFAALAGATVLANLSASNVTVAKADYRRMLCASQSARAIAAQVYVAAGTGESTTDMAWDGHALIYENGEQLAESERFRMGEQLVTADVDVGRLVTDRMRTTSFADCAGDHMTRLRAFRRVPFAWAGAPVPRGLRRTLERFPYVPHDPARRDERCHEVYDIQVAGLTTRMRAAGIERIVVGVSGGLDSTHALLVAVRACHALSLPATNVLAYTMPGFATSVTTRQNALDLMAALGVTAGELDIRAAAGQMLETLGHPAARGESVYDTTYENVQAGERTSHLFRLANQQGALVLGTGDLSELALGWCTYGVGDQMSHYAVNASVPKTLIAFLIRWVADTGQLDAKASAILRAVVQTEISPELIPREDDQASSPGADSESVVGPYELVDFFLYYLLRFGHAPSKVAFLAHHAWGDRDRGAWPELIGEEERHAYSLAEIKAWLAVFLTRFFGTSQFKRSAIPNAPKVGSGGSLSPRGDWRAPSDGNAQAWLRELAENVPDSPLRDGDS
jgi:NAD+ synthase (glutamine-hydrolysing)